MRTCYLHAGTHKTGTTSLQALLTTNAKSLAGQGICVPVAGRSRRKFVTEFAAHHNLAWQLARHPNFESYDGTLDATLSEIKRSEASTAIISSEEFVNLHTLPDALQTLAAGFAWIGFRVKVVLYVRTQADYLQALYVELVKQGIRVDFDRTIESILSKTAPEALGQLDYSVIADAFARVFGADSVIVRPYERDRAPEFLLRDFFASVPPLHDVDFDALENPGLLNRSPSFMNVLSLMHTHAGRQGVVGADPSILARRHFSAEDLAVFNRRFDVLRDDEIARLEALVAAGNERIHDRYGVEVQPPAQRTPALLAASTKQRQLLAIALSNWNAAA